MHFVGNATPSIWFLLHSTAIFFQNPLQQNMVKIYLEFSLKRDDILFKT